MRKLLLWALILALLMMGGCKGEKKEYQDPYDREAAIEYAYRYAVQRNPEYADFQNNCTNYISQILVAGGKEMDEPIAPRKDHRITYHNQKNRWFSASMASEPERWREFSVSTSFCRTGDFVDYWSGVRGMEISRYKNNIVGLKALYKEAREGDVILLYKDGKVLHLCLLVAKRDFKLLVNANTNDYYEHNIMAISPQNYPEIGLMKME